MADNHLFPEEADYSVVADLLKEHNDLHAEIRVADEAKDQDELDVLSTRVDDNVQALFEALGGPRGLYGLVHIAGEALAHQAAKGIDLVSNDGENAKGMNAFIYEGGRLAELATLVLLTRGGGPQGGLERGGFEVTVTTDLGGV